MDNFKKQVDKIVAGDYNPIVVDCNNKIVNGHRLGSSKTIRVPRDGCCQTSYKISTIVEKWSRKYKKSINCKNPKRIFQKAHCAGRKKK